MDAMFREIKFTDADVANPGDFIPAGDFNPQTTFLIMDRTATALPTLVTRANRSTFRRLTSSSCRIPPGRL